MLYEIKHRVRNSSISSIYAEHRAYQIWHDVGFINADILEEYNILVKVIEHTDQPPL